MRETLVKGQVLAMSVDHSGVSASTAPNASRAREDEVEDEQGVENLASAAKSAFEITSVTTEDDLETSMVRPHPASADAELLKGSGSLLKRKASGESQDNISLSEDLKVEGATGDKSKPLAGETSENSIAVSDSDTRLAPGGLASHSQTQIQGVAAVGGNGPNVQLGASRFKRVNNYVRGRWHVRDTSEPEERPESSELLRQMGPKTTAESSSVATFSPMVPRRSTLTTEHSETSQHSRTSSDVGQSLPVPAGGVGGGGQRELRDGGEGDSSSDRDAHLDRNSTAADTLSLSRNTSFSSIATAGEQKSIDGDEHLRDTDTESVASSVPGGTTPDLREPATTHPPPPQSTQTAATVTAAPVPAVTSSVAASSSTLEHGQNCTCDSCSQREKGQGKRVATALHTLTQELNEFLQNNTQLENLKQQNDTLTRENEELKQENSRLQDDNSYLQKDVTRLKRDIAQLQQDRKRLSEELQLLQKLQQQGHLQNIPNTTASVSERFESLHNTT